MTANLPPEDAGAGLPSYGSYGSGSAGSDSGDNYPPTGGGYPPTPSNLPFSVGDAISAGWRGFTANIGPWLILGIGALVVGAVGVGLIVGSLNFSGMDDPGADPLTGARLGLLIPGFLVIFLIGLVLAPLAWRAALDVADGKKVVIGSLFGRIPWAQVIGWTIAIQIVSGILGRIPVIGSLLGAVLEFVLWFAIPAIIDGKATIGTAGQLSWKLISTNFGNSLLLAILSAIILLVGVCPAGLGLLVAYPVVTVAGTYAYRKFSDQPYLG